MDREQTSPDLADSATRAILDRLADQREIDFNAYRPGTVRRRIRYRCRTLGLAQSDYARFLAEHPEETDALLDALTINVSRFFRDPLVYEILQAAVLPGLIEASRNDILRIWSAGCARGEEPYSVAILLKELCARGTQCPPPFILATDIDREALADAARAVYPEEAVGEVKKQQLDAWFRRTGDRYALHPEIRSLVAFTRHDVTACRPPKCGVFSEYHLILCRNLFMYFERELRDRVLHQLSAMLRPGGYLVLGSAEAMNDDAFRAIAPHSKIYRKGSGIP